MKTRQMFYVVICVLAGTMGLTTSCQRESVYDSDAAEKTTDLKVPSGFDWTTTQTVKLLMSSEVTTTVNVYLDKSCSEGQLVAKLPLSKEVQEVVIDVPKGNSEIYVQYPVKDGQNKVVAYSLNAPTKTSSSVSVKLPEDAVEMTYEFNECYYLLYSSGNVMFEDNWPMKGDYDFNDFVARYKFINRLSLGNGDYSKEGVTLTVDFLALGGMYPYHLGLQLDKLPAKFIESFEVQNATEGITAEFVNPGEDTPAIFIFKGCENWKGRDGKYFNTEKGHIVADSKDLPTVTIYAKVYCFNNPAKDYALKYSGLSENQNFFLKLRDNGSKEIHLMGYEPTHFYQDGYKKDAQDKMSEEIKYRSVDGFVWGIKVPQGTPYPYEGVDILKAFPTFGNWVTTNGNFDYVGWYKTPVNDLVVY